MRFTVGHLMALTALVGLTIVVYRSEGRPDATTIPAQFRVISTISSDKDVQAKHVLATAELIRSPAVIQRALLCNPLPEEDRDVAWIQRRIRLSQVADSDTFDVHFRHPDIVVSCRFTGALWQVFALSYPQHISRERGVQNKLFESYGEARRFRTNKWVSRWYAARDRDE